MHSEHMVFFHSFLILQFYLKEKKKTQNTYFKYSVFISISYILFIVNEVNKY